MGNFGHGQSQFTMAFTNRQFVGINNPRFLHLVFFNCVSLTHKFDHLTSVSSEYNLFFKVVAICLELFYIR